VKTGSEVLAHPGCVTLGNLRRLSEARLPSYKLSIHLHCRRVGRARPIQEQHLGLCLACKKCSEHLAADYEMQMNKEVMDSMVL
jgi:predicted anti-sigma-YlaC factor YlaD